MSATSHIPLELALERCTEALEAARAGGWLRVEELVAERDKHLALGHPKDDRSLVIVQLLLQRNAELMALTAEAQGAVAQRLQQQKYSHRALSAYISSSEEA
ncbi:MAG TPA: hypothetical protein VIM98_20090 [Dyella sp.]|uniref:hypothetical protein n=1 Tax=Dyella sp. TaxID=1869338 RepID=UPI002F92E153